MGVGIRLRRDSEWNPAGWVGRLAAGYIIPEVEGDVASQVKARLMEMYLYPGAVADFQLETPEEIRALYRAVLRGWRAAREKGPQGWNAPEAFPDFLSTFAGLIYYIRCDPRLAGAAEKLPDGLPTFEADLPGVFPKGGGPGLLS